MGIGFSGLVFAGYLLAVACVFFVVKALWHRRELSRMQTEAHFASLTGSYRLKDMMEARAGRAGVGERSSFAIVLASGLAILAMIICYF